jgi:hypothetical protein
MQLAKSLRKFLRDNAGKGTVNIPDEVMQDYLEGCKTALETIFKGRSTSNTLRVSDLGKSSEFIKGVLKGERPQEDLDYNNYLIFWRGYVFEALGEALLELSGNRPTEKQTKIRFTVDTPENEVVVSGTLDFVHDGKVYDLKTANDRSYNEKFKSSEALAADDRYNYLTQGAAYQKGSEKPFGGWLVINPNTCQMKDVPLEEHIRPIMEQRFEQALDVVREALDEQ